jgi:flagellar assembly factor FliW
MSSGSASTARALAPECIDTPFGTFPLDRRAAIEFPEGLPGFERCARFVLLASDELAPFCCLHAVEGPPSSFLAIDPRLVVPGYRALLSQTDQLRLGCREGDDSTVVLALVGFDDGGTPYANLRAPVVINPARMRGCQVMPHQSPHPIRSPLSSLTR